jgi:broad specificity phosphatase PhoE
MIYLLRHGETVWNRAGRLQGRADSPLTLRGVELVIRYGDWLDERVKSNIAADSLQIYTSPLGRARQTAALLADQLGVPALEVREDPLLAEHDVGDWSGSTWPEIERDRGDDASLLQDWDHRPPNGEARREMLARSEAWLAVERTEAVSIVVAHGGTSRALRGAYLGAQIAAIRALPTHVHGLAYMMAEGRVEEVIIDARPSPPEALLG